MRICPGCSYKRCEPADAECEDCGLSFAEGPEFTFAVAVRRLTSEWPRPPEHLQIDPPEAGLPMIAWLDICADGSALLTVGVHFDGREVRADRLHNQLLSLPVTPSDLHLTASGTPEALAEAAVDWLRSIVRRQVVRQEWHYLGKRYARRWVLADTGQGLVESVDLASAPLTLGRRETRGLPAPDRVVPVATSY